MLILKNVNLVNVQEEKIEANTNVVIDNGIIIDINKNISISKNANVLNLNGKTVIPGLIDAHLHLLQCGVDDYFKPYSEKITTKLKRNINLNLKSGVTTLRNMPGGKGYDVVKYRDLINSNKIKGPRILTSGPALSAPYGYFSTKMFFPFNSLMRFILKKIYKVTSLSTDVDNVEQAKKAVSHLKEKGVDFIKTTSTGKFIPFMEKDPSIKTELLKMGLKEKTIEAEMKPEVLESIINEAHNLGLKVAAHNIYFTKDFKQAVEFGVDSIEHTPFGLIDDETFSLMKTKNTYWVPTAFCVNNYLNLIDNPESYKQVMKDLPKPFYTLGEKTLEKHRQLIENNNPFYSLMYKDLKQLSEEYFPTNFKNAIQNGINIVAAVDAGASGSGYVPHGNLHKELELFVNNGMSEIDAIKSATITPAKLLGLDDKIGSIDIGKYADIVVLSNNPLDNIQHIQEIEYVIKDGDILYSKKS